MRRETTLPADYFEAMFRSDPDPWGLESRAYEAAKHSRSVEALDGRRYRQGLEVGCAGGMLTRRLADVCDHLLAVDVSPTALDRARQRCEGAPQVLFECFNFPEQTPETQEFDLLVLSEVAYYWSDEDLGRAAAWIVQQVVPGGDILLVHWTGETDYPQTGDGAVTGLRSRLGNVVAEVLAERTDEYRLDVWRRR